VKASQVAGRREDSSNWLLVLLCGVQAILVIDATIVVVALPSIGRDLGFVQGDLQWIVTTYALTFGGFLMVGGRGADLFGRREFLAGGLLLFLAASLGCAITRSPTVFLAARAVQGLGAAAVSPAALSVLIGSFPQGRPRNKALGIWSAVGAAGGIVGNFLGGVITSTIGWRWIFLLNVPICALAIAGAFILISRRTRLRAQSLDLAGAFAVTLGLGSLIFAFTEAERHGFTSSSSLLSLAAAGSLLSLFVLIEQRASHPLLPLSILRGRLAAGCLLIILSGPLFGGAYIFISLYLQDVRAYSPISTGAAFVPWPVVWATTAVIVSRRLTTRRLRVLAPVGYAVVGAGLLLLMRIGLHTGYVSVLVPALVVLGIGGGIVSVCNTIIATSGLPSADQGIAAGIINSCQQVGNAIGIALLVTVAVAREHSVLGTEGFGASAAISGYRFGIGVALGFALIACAGALVLLFRMREPQQLPDLVDLRQEPIL
jgi:EmrB/QacA subfamily drug resistance transporter